MDKKLNYEKNYNQTKIPYSKRVSELTSQKGKVATMVYISRYILNIIYLKILVFFLQPFYHYLFDRYFFYNDNKIAYSMYKYIGSAPMGFYQERIIEIPLAKFFINNAKFSSCLEVGNVTPHHFKFSHEVIDKYEVGEGIVNEDIASYHFERKYDLIISVSTLEHVGFDELEREPNKVRKSLKNMLSALNTGGSVFVTVPCNYNPEVDEIVRSNEFNFNIYFYKQTKYNSWSQINKGTALENMKNRAESPYKILAILILENYTDK